MPRLARALLCCALTVTPALAQQATPGPTPDFSQVWIGTERIESVYNGLRER